MTRNEVFRIVQDIFVKTFKVDHDTIKDTTSSDNLENWDSLRHVILIISIEKELKIKIPLGESMKLKTVDDIVASCMEKVQ
mgnify:CR=1 FL=1